MIRMSPAPAAFAASTYSFSRSDRKMPRTTRAIGVQKKQRQDERRRATGCPDPRSAAAVSSTASAGSVRTRSVMRIRHVVDPAAVVAGDRADEEADERRDDRDEEADLLRRADAVDDAAEVVAADLVRAEEVVPGRRRRRAGRGSGRSGRTCTARRSSRSAPAPKMMTSPTRPAIARRCRRNRRARVRPLAARLELEPRRDGRRRRRERQDRRVAIGGEPSVRRRAVWSAQS